MVHTNVDDDARLRVPPLQHDDAGESAPSEQQAEHTTESLQPAANGHAAGVPASSRRPRLCTKRRPIHPASVLPPIAFTDDTVLSMADDPSADTILSMADDPVVVVVIVIVVVVVVVVVVVELPALE